jgi:hypothetical protein
MKPCSKPQMALDEPGFENAVIIQSAFQGKITPQNFFCVPFDHCLETSRLETVPRQAPSIVTRSVSIEVVLFKTPAAQRCKNKGIDHNPTRERVSEGSIETFAKHDRTMPD